MQSLIPLNLRKLLIQNPAGILLFLVAGLSSCDKDKKDDPVPVDPTAPTLSFETGAGLINSNQSISGNTDFHTGLTATTNGGVALTRFQVKRDMNGGGEVVLKDTTFSSSTFTYTYHGQTEASAGTEKYSFTVINQNGKTDTRSFTLTVSAAQSQEIKTYVNTLLGNERSFNASFFAAATGDTLSLSSAKTRASEVDFAYFYDSLGFATLGAPADPATQAMYSPPHLTSPHNMGTWTGSLNTTEFVTTSLIVQEFDTISTRAAIQNPFLNSADFPSTSLGALSQDAIIAFRTTNGKYGLARVITYTFPSVVNGFRSEITLDIKVEK